MKKKRTFSPRAGKGWLFKMAWRDGKASSRKLFLFMASIVLGIAAVVSIHSFSENLQENITLQSKSLMGADFIIDARQPFNDRVKEIIDSLGGEDAREINFVSMVTFPGGASKLVHIRGLEGKFPFYGKIETSPKSAADIYQQEGMALVDATVMLQFGVEPGDSIKVGNITLPVAGSIQSLPGRSAISTGIAPPVFIPYHYLEKTGLMQKGSRLEYQYYFVAEPGTDMEKMDKNLDPVLDAEGADLDTHISTSRRMGESYENFGRFLNLIAFIALLLGCMGIASAVHIYIKEKIGSVAVLRCVGATRKQTFLIYLIQIAGMGLSGALIGTAAGLLLQQLFPVFLQEFLPVDVRVIFSPETLLMGILLGLIMSVLFALTPLINIWYVSPLQALRISGDHRKSSGKAKLIIFLCILIFTFLFSLWLLKNWLYSLAFIGGMLVTFLILAAIATLLMKGVKKYFPSSWGFVPRQSLLNLFRPNNQTLVLILTIGVGTFLISTLYFTKDFLLEKASLQTEADGPNMIVFDIQSGQKKEVADVVASEGLPVIDQIPVITMRVHSIKGKPASELRKDTTSEIRNWVLNHEFRVTYRDSLLASETVKEGKWTEGMASDEKIYISVNENFAGDAKVEVGDKVVFNVQGVLMETEIGSIRTVDWSRMRINFSIVFPEGVLEQAPQFHILTIHAPDKQASAKIQQKLVQKFPNVSIIDLQQMLKIVKSILNKISWVISFIALFSIITGIIVLIGAVKTSKYQRLKESVLLRTIGAQSKQILRITALEYLYLGLLSSLTGISLSLISSFLLAWLVFDAPFSPSPMPFLILLPGITALVVVIGLSNSRAVIKSPPMEVMRKAE